MYERFTDRARKVMRLAQQEAARHGHEYIGTEHVLLGLLVESSGVAANVLRSLRVDVRKLRAEVERNFRPGLGEVQGRLPHNPYTDKMIDYAYDESRLLNHGYVGTEHLLLGLLREQEGCAAHVLLNGGLKLEAAREEVLNLLGGDMPTSVAPAHVVVMDALSTVLSAPAELTAEQLQLVRDRVRHLNEQKEVFVAALDFTLAARCRAEAEALTLLLAWYERHESL